MRHHEDGRVVEVGARTRTIPPALRRALQHRDRSCRFPGCHVRVAEGHHLRHWAQGGPTTLSNLALPVPADPVGALRTQNAAEGLRLHARTACPGWLGERLDVGWAIGVLHPLATRVVR
jgi:hypothetical protein